MTTSEKILTYLSDCGEEVRIADFLDAYDDAGSVLLALRREDKVRLIPVAILADHDQDELDRVKAALNSDQWFLTVELA